MLRRLIFVVTPLLFLTACGGPADDSAVPRQPQAGSGLPTAAAAGTSSAAAAPSSLPADLQGRWWSWAASASNPVADETGKFCDRWQPSDVWFLAGTFGGQVRRRCSVPVGRPIVAPLVNFYSGEAQDCTSFMAHAKGGAELNGAQLAAIKVAGEEITITATAGNGLGLNAGTWQATGCGLWIYVPPLAVGTHHLKIRGESGSFKVGADYTLVVAGQPTA